jgi:ribosome-binding protein aMBF1 (putative translation factor)
MPDFAKLKENVEKALPLLLHETRQKNEGMIEDKRTRKDVQGLSKLINVLALNIKIQSDTISRYEKQFIAKNPKAAENFLLSSGDTAKKIAQENGGISQEELAELVYVQSLITIRKLEDLEGLADKAISSIGSKDAQQAIEEYKKQWFKDGQRIEF